jgi:beta-N-acetylhexosaminidase
VLREQLHFNGLVMTDTLSSTSVKDAGYAVPGATVAALLAGADMILFTSTSVASLTKQIVQAVVDAVNSAKLPRSRLAEAVEHILTAKNVNLCRP